MESEKLVSADGLREWLKKILLHDLSDGKSHEDMGGQHWSFV